jgi:DNA-binding beta-propeller fold protein YncE
MCNFKNYLLLSLLLCGFTLAGCDSENGTEEEEFQASGTGVFILNEGNYQAGNSTLSYYDPESKTVENNVFYRANDRKLGDTGQSLYLDGDNLFIAVENSGIIWKIDAETFKVKGQLESSSTGGKMINPRYIHFVSDTKAYVTDLYSPYVNVFNPTTMEYIKSISTGQELSFGYASTEEMVKYGKYVFTNCWSYSNKLLVIDTDEDKVCDEIVLTSYQPKSMKIDKNGKIWVITDGGYTGSMYSDDYPCLYKIDAATRKIEQEQFLDSDEANVQIALNGTKDVLYLINNDIYKMSVTDTHLPVRPFINAEVDANGTKHKLYGLNINPKNGDVYVADAVDYSQAGVIYRYSSEGTLIDKFTVGVIPNGFCFK